jgi:hypothetical protein
LINPLFMKRCLVLYIFLLASMMHLYGQNEVIILNIQHEKELVRINKHDPDPKALLGVLGGGENIATATVINSLPYSNDGMTTGYTDDYNEICPYYSPGGRDVVYSYTPSVNQSLDISLCHDLTNFDTKLYIYDIPTPVSGDAIDCNDDYCSTLSFGYPWVSSLFDLAVTAGTTYYIVVDGYSAYDYGNYTISVNEAVVYPVPPNDDCNSAAIINGPFPQTVLGTTLGSTIDCAANSFGGVWYAISLPYPLNILTVDWCGTANMFSVGNAFYNVCPSGCGIQHSLINEWQQCETPPGANTAFQTSSYLPGPTTIYYLAVTNPQMNHVITFNVTEDSNHKPDCAKYNLGLLTISYTPQFAAYPGDSSYYWSFYSMPDLVYSFSSCGSGEDTYLAIYYIFDPNWLDYTNDNYGPYCATTEASMDYHSISASEWYVGLTRSNLPYSTCENLNYGGSIEYYMRPLDGAIDLGYLTPTTTPQTSPYNVGGTYSWSFDATTTNINTFSTCGCDEDTHFSIYNDQFNLITDADDGPYCISEEASFDFTPSISGTYYISLSHQGGSAIQNAYSLTYYYTSTCLNNTWTGVVSNAWTDPGNWSCGSIPSSNVTVTIPAAPSGGVYPVIPSGVTAECYEIILEMGATFVVQTGGILNVINP